MSDTNQSISTLLLSVPQMCCAGEFRVVETHVKSLSGVQDLAPNYSQRLVRVRYQGLSDEAILRAAQASGLVVERVAPPAGAASV
ncbi:heavy-metal-associated domain-containing protein [Comamonas thiooxydans]|uniref:heavy-metal-associated domain-containing protein n=1 Tax=Comamonas thiooxydans TaxID=363952 RepID=UPI002115B641|nr:heavy-metal-associated domain-containing protein [Comamonas thiooxydans]UUE95134.1 heavy-metal-associated domain-containing protein [Comamonas thiooxydans]